MSAARTGGRSVFVSFCRRQFVALWIGCRVSSDKSWKILICVFGLCQLVTFWIWCRAGLEASNPFRRDVTLLWNMAGKCEVGVIRVFC